MIKAIIIGSGIAGIASAIRLVAKGYKVDVFEKNDYPGGKLTFFEENGYHFDAGPSLFTQPFNVVELFQELGENPLDHFEYSEVPIACKYFYPSGKTLKAFTDIDLLASEVSAVLGESAESIKKYLYQSSQCYENIGKLFTDYSLHKIDTFTFKKVWNALKSTKLSYLFDTLHQYNKKSFVNPETVQLFDRYATYNGSNPYTAPGMLSLIPHLEINEGTFFPRGGMISITNSLVKLAERHGVTFHYKEPIIKINHLENKVKSVQSSVTTYECEVLVCNMDIYYALGDLLGDQKKSKAILQQERSSSALIFYWGINRTFKELELHNILFSANYQKEFDCLFNQKQVDEDPTIYINISSKADASLAPSSCENWFVMVNAPYHQGQDWNSLSISIKSQVIHKINKMLNVDINEHICLERILDPLQIQQKTSSHTGSLYGSSSNSKMAAFLRHPNFSKIKGLYFVGGSVHPGGGIPLCLKSAKIVSDLIAKDYAK